MTMLFFILAISLYKNNKFDCSESLYTVCNFTLSSTCHNHVSHFLLKKGDFFAFWTSGICWNFSSKLRYTCAVYFPNMQSMNFPLVHSPIYTQNISFFSSKQLEQQKWSIPVLASHIPWLNPLPLLSHSSSSSHVSWTWRALGLQGGICFLLVQPTHSRKLQLMAPVTVTEGLNTYLKSSLAPVMEGLVTN